MKTWSSINHSILSGHRYIQKINWFYLFDRRQEEILQIMFAVGETRALTGRI
jgi:hypothetical protein